MSHDLHHWDVLYGVESFGEVQLEQNNLMRRPLALVNIFKLPCKTVLDGSPLNEPILVLVYDFQNNFLQTIGQYFCDNF